MRVLHLFDKYLNTTMNWAAELLLHTPDVEQHIAAPWIVKNEFHHPAFHYHYGGWQKAIGHIPDSEWDGGWREKVVRGLESKTGWWLKGLEKLDFDVIHAHFGPVGVKALPLAQKTGKPLVVSFYGYDVKKTLEMKPAMLQSYQNLFEEAAALHTTGHALKSELVHIGCPLAKLTLIPLNLNLSSIQKKVTIPDRARKFVQVCSFTEKKGIPDTIHAFAQASARAPEISLTFIGELVEQDVLDEAQSLIELYRLEQSVEILGFQPNEAVKRTLHQYDIFIHPSFKTKNGDMEGLPVSMKEAMAAGLPVISTMHSDIPDAVIDGKTGFLCPERDISCLAAAITRCFNLSKENYRSMSEAASELIAKKYAIETAGTEMHHLYQRAALSKTGSN